MKLKLDDQGHVVVQDGRPVYVHDDGKEVAFDVPGTVATITRLNGEAKTHREAKEAAEARAKAFEGIEDADAARHALETLKNIDEGKLFQAGKVEEIKSAAAKAAQDQVAAASKAHGEELSRTKLDLEQRDQTIHGLLIGGSFKGSKLISDKFAIPADLVEARFGQNFKVEGGQVVAYDGAGNKIYSRARPGEIADFDEALESIVDNYPYRDNILKGSGANGGGAPNNGGKGGGKTLNRAAFDALDPGARAAHIGSGGTLTD
ncbi:MAG TPA: hypothetical protein DIW52_27265 [Pseudomonas sp.]|nr:hypothetical protein [Pseudomonas sp.]